VNWQLFVCINRSFLVNGLSNDIHDSAETSLSNGHLNWKPGVSDFLSSDESLSGIQSNSSDVVSSQVLGDFQDKSMLSTLNLEGIVNGWKLTVELDIDDGTNNLWNFSRRLSFYAEGSSSYELRKHHSP